MYTYEELKQQKASGKKLSWDDITQEQLSYLYIDQDLLNGQIADLYDVSDNKVTAKRKDWQLMHYDKANRKFYKTFFDEKNIDFFSRALTGYAFRSGPIEDMHVAGQLKDSDMKKLNKYMVNRLAGLFTMMSKSEWIKIDKALSLHYRNSLGWDSAKPDTKAFDIYSSDINEW